MLSEIEKQVLEHVRNQVGSLQEYMLQVERGQMTILEFIDECETKGYQIMSTKDFMED